MRMLSLVVSVWLFLFLALSFPSAMPQVAGESERSSTAVLTEWTVPTLQSAPSALALDHNGRCCWFLEYYGNKIGHLDPATGMFQEWNLPVADANPYDIAVSYISGSVVLWGTEIGTDKIFAFWPGTGALREYRLPHSDTGISFISVEPTGSAQVRVWFTETTANRNGEMIYDPATSNATLYEDSFPSSVGGGAFGVYATPNSIWFAGFSAIVRWDRSTQQYSMYPLPKHGSIVARSMTLDAYGDVWFTQGSANGTSLNNYVGVIRGNAVIESWQIPTLGADPGSISINPITQQPWIVEQSRQLGNSLVAVLQNSTGGQLVQTTAATAPSGGSPVVLGAALESLSPSVSVVAPTTSLLMGPWNGPFSEYDLPSGSQSHDVVVDAAGNVWISEPGSNKIARISEPGIDFAASAAPSYLSLNQGGSATVIVTGSSISDFAGPLTLTTTEVPAGVTISDFTPRVLAVPAEGNATATVTVTVNSNVSNGTDLILIHASNGTLDHTTSIILTVAAPGSASASQCLITTATVGSQLSPTIQLLRSFRDNVQMTRSGESFLIGFNAWYYSFSPVAAKYISHESQARVGFRLLIYPLVGAIYLAYLAYKSASFSPELAVLAAGFIVSSIVGILYLGLPLGIMNRKLRLIRRFDYSIPGLMLVTGMVSVLVGLMTSYFPLLMASTSLFMLACLFLSTILTINRLSGENRRVDNYLAQVDVYTKSTCGAIDSGASCEKKGR